MNVTFQIENDWVGICSILIAVIAIIFTWKQMKLQQKHNILSVTPIPSFYSYTSKDEIKILLTNKGIGPLIIKSLTFILNKKVEKSIGNFFSDAETGFFDVTYSVTVIQNSACQAGETRVLCQFSRKAILEIKESEFQGYINTLRNKLSNIKVEISYTDIYNTEFDLLKTDLSYLKI